jgi:hypothetical protein
VTTFDRPGPPSAPAVPVRRVAALSRFLPGLFALAHFAAYAGYSLRRHHRIESTGFDLGIFEQVVRGYAAGRAPVVPLKGPGFPALGDHFHPILALLAPLYRLVPSAETLLVAQAALIAASTVPIGRAAVRILGPGGGMAVTVGYGLSWGLQEAVGFDFHEVCFAVPLVALSLCRLLDRRWAAAIAWAAPLLLVKEDLSLTVAAIGGYVFLRGPRRLGALTVLAGASSGLVIVKVILPAFHPAGGYPYAAQLALNTDGLDIKARTLVLLLAPTLFLAARSPLILIAIPTLAWRFVADNPSYWGDGFHYSAVLMPIMAVAMLDAIAGRPGTGRSGPAQPHQLARRRWSRTVALGYLAVSLALAPDRPLWRLTEPAFWRTQPAVAAAHRLLDRIPDGAVVAATNGLAPHLTSRCEVRLLAETPAAEQDAEWIAADRLLPVFVTPAELRRQLAQLHVIGYRTVTDDGRFVLLRRPR